MDGWNHTLRFASIHEAINRIPHDQTAMGMGFNLTHNPESCVRCRAFLATNELTAMFKRLEEGVKEGESIGV